MTDNNFSTLSLPDNHFLAYHKFTPATTDSEKNHPTVVFFGGFKSDMQGSKALFLESFCTNNNIPFLRFDYLGHGQSSGDFTDFTLGDWLKNCLSAIDELTQGKILIVGSSMGGWLMLLCALKRPERISSLLGIASAPDFTEDLMWNMLTEKEKNILQTEGIYTLPLDCHSVNQEDYEPYTITHNLITEARNHMLLKDKISINCPIHLLHGINDEDVPYQTSLKISELVESQNVTITLQKNGDHRMSSQESLQLLQTTLENILQM